MKNNFCADIKILKDTENALRKNIKKYLVEKNFEAFDPRSSNLQLDFCIHDRPISWIYVEKVNSDIVLQSTKGYIAYINALEFDDIIKILNHIG